MNLSKDNWVDEFYKKNGHSETVFNEETGELLLYHYGKPGSRGHRSFNHYHRLKPDGEGGYHYLDKEGNVVSQGSEASHLYDPKNVLWKNISDYDFHDGFIIKIVPKEKTLDFYLESAEIDQERMGLSKNGTIKGILHLADIEGMYINNDFVKAIPFPYDYGTIYDFTIEENKAVFVLNGVYQTLKFQETEYVKVEIFAKEIVWENIPDLDNPHRE